MNILVTGANGQLGREMQRLGAVSPNNYLFTDVTELDITDPEAVRRCVTGNRIGAIVNCAAYTNVERAEEDEATADRLNRAAVGNLARAAAEADALLVHVSTDYVFDGCASLPYTEEDPTAPRSAYGRTKLAGEEAVRASGCRHLILRTAWLYSEYGSILEGGLDRGHEGTYHFSDEGVCSWYDFAVEIARAAGHDRCRISPCRTADYPTKAVRPAFSVLDKGKLKRTFGIEIPHWRESMFYCLKRLQAMQNQPSEQS